jgi:S-DNA-T family DNA segregation ATPase FtsK/SpoIIIE
MAFFSRSSSRKFKVKKSNSLPLLPASMQSFLARRLTDLSGLWFAATGASLALTLFTFNAKDPSFNTVSSAGSIHNIFGSFGAYAADMLLQTLGLASYFFALAFMVWGYRILTRKPMGNFSSRISLLIAAVLSGSITLARIPSFDSWGIGSYLGGSAGALIFSTMGNHLQGWLGTTAFAFVAISSFFIFATSYLLSLGISFGEWSAGFGRIRSAAAEFYAASAGFLTRFSSWHSQYSSSSAPQRVTRIRLQEEAAPETEAAANDAGNTLSAPRRKPVDPPRA